MDNFLVGESAFLLDKKANKMVRFKIRPRVKMCLVVVIFDNRGCLKEALGSWQNNPKSATSHA